MALVVTTTPAQIRAYFERLLLESARPFNIHGIAAWPKRMPQNSGNQMLLRRYNRLTADTTPLTEGVTKPGESLSVTDINQTLVQHGAYFLRSDIDLVTREDDELGNVFTELLGGYMGDVLDLLERNELLNTTNIQWAGAAVSRITVAAGMTLADAEVAEARMTFRTTNIHPITSIILPGQGQASQPIGPAYIGLVHSNCTTLVEALTGFVPVHSYASYQPIHEAEMGYAGNVRWLHSTNGKIWAGLGAGAIDVYSTLLIGRINAFETGAPYADIPLDNKGLEWFNDPPGSAGSADPMHQRGSIAAKRTGMVKLLNSLCVIDLEHSLT